MFQRGEPLSYLPLLVISIVIGLTIFVSNAASDATITGAASGIAAPICSTGGICYSLAGLVLGALVFAIWFIHRK